MEQLFPRRGLLGMARGSMNTSHTNKYAQTYQGYPQYLSASVRQRRNIEVNQLENKIKGI